MSMLGSLRAAREWAYPMRTTSAFLEKGVLTPEEFVRAGDELVFKCPTWSWEAGDPARAKSYLPPDKQYLVTRNVPCQTRVSAMENTLATENLDGDEGDWLVSSVIPTSDGGDIEADFDILDDDGELVEATKKPAVTTASTGADNAGAGMTTNGVDDDDEDEYADMDGFEDDNVLEDDAAAATTTNLTTADNSDNLLKVRTYDLSITYDKYYQTPRVWMMGYRAASHQPLTGKEMLEDVISDYANRTVTIENHPHVRGPHASIHPCQHGKVMKVIVRNLINTNNATDGDEGPSVEMYLFIFLKFVSSIIPTINYDFTMDVTADTSK